MTELAAAIWDCNPSPRRTVGQWRAVIDYLAVEMATHFGRKVRICDFWVDDQEGDKSGSACARVAVVLSREVDLLLYGSMCVTINYGEMVSISADLMFFCGGLRFGVHRLNPDGLNRDLLIMTFCKEDAGRNRWVSHGLTSDEFGEWESLQEGPSMRHLDSAPSDGDNN